MVPENYLAEGWKEVISDLFDEPYYNDIRRSVAGELKSGHTVYPPLDMVLNAFRLTSFSDLEVVILGQDPYHNPGQAHGLAFSVPEGIRVPPSLKTVYKEILDDTGRRRNPDSGCLEDWCRQGVFLLNSVLTVRAGEAASHSGLGWQRFTDEVIHRISERKDAVVFMLWGNYARSKKPLIDASKHLVLEAAHPSPLARGAFFGCRHFSRCNEFLRSRGKKEIVW